MDYNEKTKEYRMLDHLKPRVSALIMLDYLSYSLFLRRFPAQLEQARLHQKVLVHGTQRSVSIELSGTMVMASRVLLGWRLRQPVGFAELIG